MTCVVKDSSCVCHSTDGAAAAMMLKQDGGMSAPVRSVTWSYLSETETCQISHEPQPETIQVRCALRPEVRKVTWYNRKPAAVQVDHALEPKVREVWSLLPHNRKLTCYK